MRVRCPECDVSLTLADEDAGRTVECPDCGERFRARDDRDARPRRSGTGGRRGKGSGSNTGALVATGVVALVAAGVVIWVVAGRNKPQAVVALPKGPEPAPPATPPAGLPGQAGLPDTPQTAALKELFRLPVDAPPATRRLVKVEKAAAGDPPLVVPAFPPPKGADPAAGKLTADEAKAATAYIKVGGADRLSTGSGFLVARAGGNAFVATNRHVIDDALEKPAEPGGRASTVTVVFNSNVPGKEVSLPATIVGVHPDVDLAVLRVPAAKVTAKPIDPWTPAPLTEGTEVRILGFPLGENLARGGASPNISISPGTVSSLRTDKGGKLEQVQITGPLIPGNSGGPIVDADGRLAGVAVSTLRGTGIGFAVPAGYLADLLGGKCLPGALVPHALDGETARFKVALPLVDPLGRVKAAHLRYRVTGGKPDPQKDDATGHKLLEPAERVDLRLAAGPGRRRVAAGELALPAATTGVVLQLVAEDAAGAVTASPQAAFALSPGDVASGRDAGSFADFVAKLKADPGALAGKVQVVRGKILARPDGQAPHQDVGVVGPDGRPAPGVRFLVDREASVQFDEVGKDQEGLDVRLVVIPGTPWPEGQVPVRVARVDYLDEYDRPVRSIPGDPADDKLAAVNRDPDKFADQYVELTAEAVFGFDRAGLARDFLLVVFPSHRVPRNLRFATVPALTQRLADEQFRPFPHKVRLGGTVAARPDKLNPAPFLVKKVQLLGANGEVLKTFE